jgi:molybdate transport system regulatory protein
MSYRRGWQLVASLNESFEELLISASPGGRGGGGATLTPLGREVIQAYRAFEDDVQQRAAVHFRHLARRIRSTAGKHAKAAPIVRMNTR